MNSDEKDTINNIEIAQTVLAVITFILSTSVVFILLYKYNVLVKGRVFVHSILMIALSDSFAAIAYTLGYPNEGHRCRIQGFILIFFNRNSWFWTDALMINIYSFIIYRKLFTLKTMHIFIWTINIILQLLPIITNTYWGGLAGSYGYSN